MANGHIELFGKVLDFLDHATDIVFQAIGTGSFGPDLIIEEKAGDRIVLLDRLAISGDYIFIVVSVEGEHRIDEQLQLIGIDEIGFVAFF